MSRSSDSFDAIAERVLVAVEQIPPGEVVSYGDLAELVGTAPRVVGAVMVQYGHEVAWWRVTDRMGRLPQHLMRDAALHWDEESIAHSSSGCRIANHRADLDDLSCRWQEALRG